MSQRKGYIEFIDGSKIDIFETRNVIIGTELITSDGLYCLAEKSSTRNSSNHLYKITVGRAWEYTKFESLRSFGDREDGRIPETNVEEVGFKQVVETLPWYKTLGLYFKRNK